MYDVFAVCTPTVFYTHADFVRVPTLHAAAFPLARQLPLRSALEYYIRCVS